MNYNVGQRFIINNEEYILSQTMPTMMCLINAVTGLRYGDKLEDWGEIGEKAMNHMCLDAKWELKDR